MNTVRKLIKDNYSYADYLSFSDDVRVEIIDGVVYDMSPAPRRFHQEISMNLSREISSYLRGKDCKIYSAPFDVRLSENTDDDFSIKNVVQPDLSIICDKNKLDERGCVGAPDWIIEILSPSTSSKDFNEKFKLYEKFGVKEYWIVEPTDKFILVFVLNDNGKYENTARFTKGQKAKTTIFEDLEIDLDEIFE